MKKNTGKAPSIQFYYKDFLADMAEHEPDVVGVWILLLIKIWHCNSDGSVTKTLGQFARIMNTDEVNARRLITYLRDENIADVTEDNGRITVTNRRSKRDAKLREENRLRQLRFRRQSKNNADVAPEKPNPSTSSSTSFSTSVKKTFSETSDEYRLSNLLLKIILSRKPDFKKPNLQSWSKNIDLMIRVDERATESIEKVIRWCQADYFWQNNILSTNKLRKHFDKLELKANERQAFTANQRQSQGQSSGSGYAGNNGGNPQKPFVR